MKPTNLQDLYAHPAPFVTVHTEVGRPTEDARQQLDARWTSIRHQLEHEGVDAGLVEAIGERLRELPDVAGEARRTIVAADGAIRFDQLLAGHSPTREAVDVGRLPDLAGWLAQADRQHPFALVVADREGADIGFHPGLGSPTHEELSVEGEDFYITKVAEGDWAHKQFQQTAENTWARNAAEVADEVRSGLRSHPAEVVLLAGDDRARHLIEESLDGVQVPIVHVSAGGRAAGASQAALWEEVRRVLADVEAHADREVIDRLEQATGQGAGAALGLSEVLDAFVKGQVERLVLDPDAARELTVDPADHPGLSLPEGAEGELPADRVLIAAAVLTNADISVLPADETKGGGIAALLRWDQ